MLWLVFRGDALDLVICDTDRFYHLTSAGSMMCFSCVSSLSRFLSRSISLHPWRLFLPSRDYLFILHLPPTSKIISSFGSPWWTEYTQGKFYWNNDFANNAWGTFTTGQSLAFSAEFEVSKRKPIFSFFVFKE